MPSRRPDLATLAVLACAVTLGAAVGGCSIALDFDRTYPKPTGLSFPSAHIKAPNEGEVPLTGGALLTACTNFCEAYVGCLADKKECHYLWALPGDSGESGICTPEPGADKQALVVQCASDCKDLGTLTSSQLKSIQNPGECQQVAKSVLNEDDSACDVLLDECDALCDPKSGPDGLAGCGLLGMTNDACKRICEAQNTLFFECMYCGTGGQSLCDDAVTCAQTYFQAPDDTSRPVLR